MIEPPKPHQDDVNPADASPAGEKHPPEIQLEAETVSVEPVPRWIQGGPNADPPKLEVPPSQAVPPAEPPPLRRGISS